MGGENEVAPMPELHFKGKEYVFNHHLAVPHRPLVAHPDKSVSANSGDGDRQGDAADGNLIIHGDNLHALKALLPRYAGKVDCIFIDPPYNTGNESWNYNDNVNSPVMQEWLDGNPVNKEDMLRHDKWCCMMYPRLKLLHELLSEQGSLWMTLDDHEIHRARMIMDEIFGEECFIASAIWQTRKSPDNDETFLTPIHNYVVCYAKKRDQLVFNHLSRTAETDDRYDNLDNDPRGPWTSSDLTRREFREHDYYPIKLPSGREVTPAAGRSWSVPKESFLRLKADNRIWFGRNGNAMPRRKRFLTEVAAGIVATSIWETKVFGGTQEAKRLISQIFFDEKDIFQTPKPVSLIQRILALSTTENATILDSFAGSGTTAHAVLSQNAKDGGNRHFILVECEDFADSLTAERVRRIINGYEFQGTVKEELLREKISWSNFSRERAHRKILDQVQAIENLDSGEFDKIRKTIKDGELIVTGEKKIIDKAEGLGGGFTYYTLGDPLDLDKMLTGESLPDYASIGAWLFHTATGEPLNHEGIRENDHYLGESAAFHVWLIYQPNRDFLKSRDSALTLDFAKAIAKDKNKRHLVFASSRFVSNKTLSPLGVEFAPLPFALYRLEKE